MKKKAKREIWFSQFSFRGERTWHLCSKHFSRKAASKAAKECQESCFDGEKHRVRKKR